MRSYSRANQMGYWIVWRVTKQVKSLLIAMRGVVFVPSKLKISNYKKCFDHAIRSSSVRQRRKTTNEEAAGATRETETLVEREYEYRRFCKVRGFQSEIEIRREIAF